MNRTMIGTTGALLAVLLLLGAGIGAVSAADTDITFEFDSTADTTNLNQGATGTTNVGKFWSDATQPVSIYVKAKNGGATQHLSGYTASVELSGTGADTDGLTFAAGQDPAWSLTSTYAQNKFFNIASAPGTDSDLISLSSTTAQKLFQVTVPTTAVTSGNMYTLTLSEPTAALSTVALADIDNTGEVSLGSSVTANPTTFKFTPRSLPTINKFTILPYGDVNIDATQVVYTNPGPTAEITFTQTNYDADWDVIEWESGTSAIMTIEQDDTDKNKATITFVANQYGNSDISAEYTNVPGSEKKITVTSKNWIKTAMKDNKGTWDTTDDWSSRTKWSFTTPRTVTYTVNADADVGASWNSNVDWPKLTTDLDWDVRRVSTNPAAGYTVAKSTGENAGKFLITDELASRPSNDEVTITFTGFKLGDADISNSLDIKDSAVVGIHMIKGGAGILTAEQQVYADCGSRTQNEVIDVDDVIAINRLLVGLRPWST